MTIQFSVVGLAVAALLTAAVVSLISTPVVRSLAFRVGAVDVPKDNRRMHNHPIPRMGGLAIFFGFILSVLLFVPLTQQLRTMLLGAVVIVILGIFDDIYALPAMPKFMIQIAAALVAVLGGNRIFGLSNINIFSRSKEALVYCCSCNRTSVHKCNRCNLTITWLRAFSVREVSCRMSDT